jgi:glyoxylase-like metal-dependent hydrolase (beta-lactamase superfamily II)
MTGPSPATWAVDPALAGTRLVVPGLWRLRLPTAWPGVDHVNAYALERRDGLLLVDCGSAGHPSCAEALDVALAQTGHTVQDVRALAATHAHSDHVGQAADVVARSGAQLWSHPADGHLYDLLRDPERFVQLRLGRARREGVPEARIAAYATASEEVEGVPDAGAPHHALAEGTLLESALGDWEAIETPGHAPSHVCLVQRERRLVIAGDLVCIAFTPWMDYGFSADPLAETLASLGRLEALGPIALALPGHGRPLTDLPEVVGEHRRGFAALLDGVRAALAAGPTDGYALATALHGDEEDVHAVAHLVEVLAVLAHLRGRGEVLRAPDADGINIYTTTGGRT